MRDGVDLLRIGEDVGRAAAVNRAVAALAPGIGWVAVASPGVQWRPGALDVLLAAAERRPRAAALGPLVRDGDGTVLPTAGPLPSPADLLRGRLAPGPPVDGPVGRLSAACVLLRRVAWDSVDGFDPRYLGVLDDVDLADRLGRAGWLCVHVPAAEVVLTRGATLGWSRPPAASSATSPTGNRGGDGRCCGPAPRSARGDETGNRKDEGCCTTSRPWCWSAGRAPGCGRSP